MILVELLLSVIIILIAWMRVSTASQETAFEFEERLRNYFGVELPDARGVRSDENDEIGVLIKQATFEEFKIFRYLLKRAFWPWQEIDGKVTFDIRSDGFVIADADEFNRTLSDSTKIMECTHEGHDSHYYLKVDGIPTEPFESRMINLELIHYYVANSELAGEYWYNQRE